MAKPWGQYVILSCIQCGQEFEQYVYNGNTPYRKCRKHRGVAMPSTQPEEDPDELIGPNPNKQFFVECIDKIYKELDTLQALLMPYDKHLQALGMRPVANMSAAERMAAANLIKKVLE